MTRWVLLLFALVARASAVAAQESTPPNPFAVFESYRLPNGLKVWYGRLPGATVTSIALIAPVGFDRDPPGKEQTAHLLEHVLLSDRHGDGEGDLARALTSHGGSFGGVTYPDRTYYWVNITTDQAAYGLRWLYGVVQPREFTNELVDRNREPVAIETRARPRTALERLASQYIRHPGLRPASFWEREFGLSTAADRSVDAYAALHAIRAQDLQAFHDAHYTPTAMTLVVVSGAARSTLQPVLSETFGVLPWRAELELNTIVTPREGGTNRYSWWLSRNTTVRLAYRIPALTGQDQLRLALIAGLLERRLMHRLRRGNDKSVYSISVQHAIRGPASMLVIAADMNPAREKVVRAAINDEIDRIINATADSTFDRDRDALAHELNTRYASPDALRALVADRLYRPDLHAEFPNLGRYIATAGADSIAAYAGRLFVPAATILRLWRPLPVSPAWLLLAVLLTVWLAVRTYRAAALRPADMHAIRYVAHIRHPARFICGIALLLAVLLAARIIIAGAHAAAEYVLLRYDSFLLHLTVALALVFGLALLALLISSRVPRKVLVFENELRIKSATFRSVIIPGHVIHGVRLSDPATAALPPWRLANRVDPVVIELVDGSTRTVHVRQPTVFLTAVAELVRRTRPAGLSADRPIPVATGA